MIAAQTGGGRCAARVSYGIRRPGTSAVGGARVRESPRTMSSVIRLTLAGCLVAVVAACASAPAAPDLTPPPRRPVDAKTQLEYGNPPPPPAPGRY
jgi:hypothetical protein